MRISDWSSDVCSSDLTELAVLWIATAWLATGLYIAPLISGHEPKFQRLGVNFLWVCLLVIVVGSFAGQWFAVMDKMGLQYNFWFGHQGWEYRSEEHTSELQSLMRISYAVFCLKKKITKDT